jgi:hypothetical protein
VGNALKPKTTKGKEQPMEVAIIESETGKVVASYTINLQGLNYTPSDQEYFSQAWSCAVEDGVVSVDERGKYSFTFTQKR